MYKNYSCSDIVVKVKHSLSTLSWAATEPDCLGVQHDMVWGADQPENTRVPGLGHSIL